MYWRRLLEKFSVAQAKIESGSPLYKSDLCAKPLPSPHWNTLVTVIDSTIRQVERSELDPSIVKWVVKHSKGWDLSHLSKEVVAYPRMSHDEAHGESMERDIQTDAMSDASLSPPVSPISFVRQDLFLSALKADLTQELELEITKVGFRMPLHAEICRGCTLCFMF